MTPATLAGFDTRWLYTGLVGLVVLERLVELVVASRNARRLVARGGRPAGDAHYGPMVALHSLLLVAAPLEVWLLGRPFVPALAAAALAVLAGTMALRYWAISTLGDRWTTRVFVVPGEAPVDSGPYRYVRHPNYLAVAFEVPAFALVHTAWLTALVFGLLDLVVLSTRIRVEEAALAATSDYAERLGERPRFLPRPGGGTR